MVRLAIAGSSACSARSSGASPVISHSCTPRTTAFMPQSWLAGWWASVAAYSPGTIPGCVVSSAASLASCSATTCDYQRRRSCPVTRPSPITWSLFPSMGPWRTSWSSSAVWFPTGSAKHAASRRLPPQIRLTRMARRGGGRRVCQAQRRRTQTAGRRNVSLWQRWCVRLR